MRHGRFEELRLGLIAGNAFTLTLAEMPKTPARIHAIKRSKGVVMADLGKSTLPGRVNHRWQPIGPGDVVRGSGQFAPIYTFVQLAVKSPKDK